MNQLSRFSLLLPEIRRKLAEIPLEELAKEVLPPEPPASAAPGAGEHADAAELGRAWRRVELMPGLELHVRADAGAVVHRMAREIREKYGCEREEG